jgi:hypothetical protein
MAQILVNGITGVVERWYGTCPVSGVVSMGRCNSDSKFNLHASVWLNSFESADSKKTLPCLGLIEYGQIDGVSSKSTIGSTE